MIYESLLLDPAYAQVEKTLLAEKRSARRLPVYLSGVCRGVDSSVCCLLARSFRPLLILTGGEKESARICADMTACGKKAAVFPGREPVLYNIAASRTFEYERLSVLMRLQRGELDAVISTAGDALGFTMPPDILSLSSFTLKRGGEYSSDTIDGALMTLGYVRCEMAEYPGQYARRGGILDIYPSFSLNGDNMPYRIEFFGDEVDRICVFDTETQRAEENRDEVVVTPAKELLMTPEISAKILSKIRALQKKAKSPETERELASEAAAIEGGLPIEFTDKYIGLIYPQKQTLMDYFGADSCFVISGGNASKQSIDAAIWRANETIKSALESGTADGRCIDFMQDGQFFDRALSAHPSLYLDSFAGITGRGQAGVFKISCRQGAMAPDRDLILSDIEDYISTGYRIAVSASNDREAQILAGILKDRDMAVSVCHGPDIKCDEMSQHVVYIAEITGMTGFELTEARFVFISLDSAGAVQKGSVRTSRRRKKNPDAKKLTSYADLKVGDYVVHETCGIGQYMGITQLTIDGVTKDYINIQYAGNDKLFIPTNQLDMVSKYIGAHSDDGLLKLSKMSGSEWKHAKARAKVSVSDMAKELIKLYAERMRLPGYAFPEDDDYQREFEEAFEYDETDSQLDAIEDIKKDMQSRHPMDRLLCGDVGYGKTEVALRAAFKAIEAGKQVAMLCPTTILAYQHFMTAMSRMHNFPIRVEMLSRFRTQSQQSDILRRLKRGDIDLIIGTHMLISGRAEFADLGLLIVDEEQRFGVAQKEKLKQMSAGTDVLMLSATPIPRTLNMAIGGIRDISILDDPPGDRQPVQTYVLEYDDIIIEDAIKKEISRGGQVFYLYNRVETINRTAARLAERIPGARIAVAHGQMAKDEVEDIWNLLLRGEIDVLVCTSIIETGVDVPNANTLIIEDADRMGLSQLHQLRGRVGRSGRRAYAYFTYRAGKALTEIAEQRLSAIRDYAQFGAGFRIALRDLEIRGAGNLLGAEQHGHLDAVGYELYMKLLSEAVLEEKGVKQQKRTPCAVDIAADAFIPESYISSQAQRIEQYKHIATIDTAEDCDDIADELMDRYGEFPQPVDNLLRIALIKAMTSKCGITRLECSKTTLTFRVEEINPEAFIALFYRLPEYRFRSIQGTQRVEGKVPKDMRPIQAATRFLEEYGKILAECEKEEEGEKNED